MDFILLEMSGQGPAPGPKVRRNVSPSQRQGPMKAVKAFTLKSSSPPRSPSSPSHLTAHHGRSPGPDSRLSPDRRSPGSPAFKVERPKPVRISPATSTLRRTGSLDTISGVGSLYVKGQWPADIGGLHHTQQSSGPHMVDQTTQTPVDWQSEITNTKENKKKKKHRRSASFTHADKKLNTLNSINTGSIRQRLKNTTKDHGNKQRQSPIPASHLALSSTAPAVLIRSAAIGIPAHKMPPRYQRNSVEGLNQEIEKLVLENISGAEEELDKRDIPDGHRAPVPDNSRTSGTRSIDTQTPSGTLDDRSSGSSASPNRPHSISPAIIGHLDQSPRPSSSYDSSGSTPRDKSDKETGDRDSISPDGCHKISTASPKPNKIVREPPDGCEKVKAFDENKAEKAPQIKEPLLFCPIQGKGVLNPSLGSAFCLLTKPYTQGPAFTRTSPIQPAVMEANCLSNRV